MRRILVTGANGFIGRAVVPALAKAGHSVCAGVRAPSEAAWLAGVDQRVIGDLGPDTDWTGALADVDAVVHLAARVHVGRPRRDRGLAGFRRVNSEGTKRLAEEAARSGVQRFLCS